MKISIKNSGSNNGMYGRVGPNAGKTFSKEYRQKLSDSHKGQIPWNKGLKGLTGIKCTEEVKQVLREANSGEGNPNAKLTWEIVELIRGEYIPGEVLQKELAVKYGVSRSVISDIIRNKTWRKCD